MAKKDDKKAEKKIKRELTFKLTAGERDKLADKWESKEAEIEKLSDELSNIKGDYKGRIDRLKLEIKKLRQARESGEESRLVECLEIRDYVKCIVQYKHGGKVIESRDMEPHERQVEMKIAEKPKFENTPRKRAVRDPSSGETNEVADVIAMETNKKTKKSAVDSVEPPPAN